MWHSKTPRGKSTHWTWNRNFWFKVFHVLFSSFVSLRRGEVAQLCVLPQLDGFDWFLHCDLKYHPCQSPPLTHFFFSFYFALCIGQSPLIPHLCPLAPLFFTLIPPCMCFELSLMFSLGHGIWFPMRFLTSATSSLHLSYSPPPSSFFHPTLSYIKTSFFLSC